MFFFPLCTELCSSSALCAHWMVVGMKKLVNIIVVYKLKTDGCCLLQVMTSCCNLVTIMNLKWNIELAENNYESLIASTDLSWKPAFHILC